ncbi:TolB family protein [Dinghuibacter silviterrae]|uniref:WD40 repeat protein n=1 Tax=Dinghuibacter silviterrae TaxID=1539049 RepID=A0A4R8DSI3_9BACT|nr:TolB family protein [Dinghuibacter silviterrae]TDX00347.1 WD40 repeat protein [Dinghuibacter silviterrae]
MKTLLVVLLSLLYGAVCAQSIGLFPSNGDVGPVLHPGSAVYDSSAQTYLVSGSGSNIWFTRDEFQYVYTRLKGDFILQARGRFVSKGATAHRKFGWMVRTGLDTGSAMVTAAVHADGLTSLQYRKQTGANVEENRSTLTAADVIQLERQGNRYIMSVARDGGPFVINDVTDLPLGDEVYVGLFVCSHNKDVTERVLFDNVRLIKPAPAGWVPYKDYLGSHIEVLDLGSGRRSVVYSAPVSLQAPNWTLDGRALLYNSSGFIYRLDLSSRTASVLNTGSVHSNNNDHVLSFDGKMLVLSSAGAGGASVVYKVPSTGGDPVQLTPTGPSYGHGWSPDGRYIVFTGQRNGDFDIYRIPATGGAEVRLTTTPGLDDGPEYSPDGQYIYFNSVRSGSMQIWRMRPDGSQPEQLTADTCNNWFPHVSPDGKWVVFISFWPSETRPDDHPFYRHVYLRVMPASGGKPRVIAYVYGGQGTINTPSWAPDSKRIAFVSNSGAIP